MMTADQACRGLNDLSPTKTDQPEGHPLAACMHIGGHHFRVLARDGRPEPLTRWRDTVTIDAMQRGEMALLADNTGKWLLNCHMVEHTAAGMMTWLEVG
jgi:FtsP/CotA-like multicopper oxidase with cupredoxin domain